jgi:hypothetical protein
MFWIDRQVAPEKALRRASCPVSNTCGDLAKERGQAAA